MRAMIDDELKSCDACLRYTVIRHGFHPSQNITALGPGDHHQIDLSVHLPKSPDGYSCLLHLIDVFTGFVVLRPLKDETAETIAKEIMGDSCIDWVTKDPSI
jgi:hypothetical protein